MNVFIIPDGLTPRRRQRTTVPFTGDPDGNAAPGRVVLT
jgi:hypothetical protein